VDSWDANWSEKQKRDAIAASIEVHRHKGTVGALKRALQAVGYEVLIDENTQTPYTFRLRVNVTHKPITDEKIFNEVERIALENKNARSHLVGIDQYFALNAQTKIGVLTIDGEDTKIWPKQLGPIEAPTIFHLYAAEQTADFVQILSTK
jgi:P2-related tail formation protein